MDLNRVTLIGNVVNEPSGERSTGRDGVVRFSLASSYLWQDATTKRNHQAVDFHDCLAFGKLGEILRQYVRKGAKLYVEGRVRNRSEKGKDGVRRRVTEIVADNVIMLGHRGRREVPLKSEA